MPNISQRISLEGAEDLQKALKSLAAVGEEAFKQLQDAAQKANIDPKSLNLGALQDQLKAFGDQGRAALDQINRAANQHDLKPAADQWKGLGSAVGLVSGQLQAFLGIQGATEIGFLGLISRGGVLGGVLALVAGGTFLLAKNAAEAVLRTDQLARGMGLSIDQFTALRKAAREYGVEQDTLVAGMTRFNHTVDTQSREQLTALVDVAKKLASDFGIPENSPLNINTYIKLNDAIRPLVPQIRALFNQTGSFQLQGLAQLTDVALADRLTQMAQKSAEFRKELAKLAVIPPPTTVFESLDQIVAKIQPGLATLGVSTLDADAKVRSTLDTFKDWAAAVAKIKDPAEQTRRVIEVFGRKAGPEMVKFIQQGIHSIDEWEAKLRQTGVLISPEDLARAREYEKQIEEFSSTFDRFRRTAGLTFLPLSSAGLSFVDDLLRAFLGLGDRIDEGNKQIVARTQIAITRLAEVWRAGIGLLGNAWDAVAAGAATAWDAIAGAASSTWQKIKATFSPESLAGVWEAIKSSAAAVWAAVASTADAAWQGLKASAARAWDEVAAVFTVPIDPSKWADTFGQWLESLAGKARLGWEKIKSFFSGLNPVSSANAAEAGSSAGPLLGQPDAIASPFQAAADQIRQLWGDLLAFVSDLSPVTSVLAGAVDGLVAPFRDAEQQIEQAWSALPAFVQGIAGQVEQAASQMLERLQQANTAAASINATSSGGDLGAGGFATGGLVRGPGSSTSDSILARLSDREFVQSARAVSAYGVDFMHAINRGLIPVDVVRSLMRGFRGFSAGGLVDAMSASLTPRLPGFAAGGLVTARAGAGAGPSRTVTFVIDGKAFGGFFGDDNAIDTLARHSTKSQVLSTGPKPRWRK